MRAKTVESWPRPGAGVLLALALFGLVRVALLFAPDLHLPVVHSTSTREWFVKSPEMRYRVTNVSPKVLAMGTSRIMNFRPKALAEELGVAAADVRVLAWPANTFFDMMAMVRRNPSLTQNLELFILDLVPVEYHLAEHFPEDDPLFFRYSTVQEKLLIQDPAVRARALFDELVPVWSARLTAEKWIDALRLVRLSQADKMPYYEAQNPVQILVDEYRSSYEMDFTEHVLNTGFPESNPSRLQAFAFQELIDLLPESCAIVCIRLPYRADVEERIKVPGRYQQANDEFKDFMLSRKSQRINVIWLEDPAVVGLVDDDFMPDGTHYKRERMEKVARIIGRLSKPFYTP